MGSIEDDILNRGMEGGSFSTSATRGLGSNLGSGRVFENRTGVPPGRSQTDLIRIRTLGEINQNVHRIHTQESVIGISRGQAVGNGRGSAAAWTRASEPGSRTSPGNVDENRRYENRRHLTREQVRAMEELGSCPICTDPTTGSVVTRCGHRFCGHCIVEWMEHNNTCPVCRKAVADDELVNDPDFEQLATIVRDDSQSATSDRRKSETFARLCHCSLCSNILDGAALTICGHRFCAHCIRQSLEDRNRCPKCHQPLRDTDLICDPDFDALTALLKTQIERRTNESQGTSSNIGTRINESQGTSSNIGTRNNVNMGTSTNASSNGGSRNNDNLRTNTNANSDAAARNSPETGGTRRDTLVQTNRMPLTQTPDNARLGPDNRSESNQGQTETARVVNQSVLNSGLQGNLSERNQSGLNRTPQINAGERNQFLATSSLQANTAASNQSDANMNPPVTTAGGNQSEVNRSSQLNETGNQSDANRGPQAEDTTQSGINTNPQVTTSEENQSRANRHPLHRGESTRFEELCNCPICADVINEAKITPCGHRFCTGCIRHWLRGHNTCPTCRNRVTISELMRDNTFDEMIAFMRSQLDSRQSRNTPRSRDLDEINGKSAQIMERHSWLLLRFSHVSRRCAFYIS